MKKKFDTLAIHGGYSPDQGNGSVAVPVHRTTAYAFDSAQHAADLFALKQLGFIYTRLGNPTQQVLEDRLALLDGGKGALALASGTAAIFNTVINLCSAGDEIISSRYLYGGTYTMFNNILPQMGITVKLVDINNPEEWKKEVTDKTRLVFCETVGNPVLEVADLEKIASAAHDLGLPLAVDSTFTPPSLLRPIEWGADLVIHSLTKWMSGHGTVLGGIVVDAGTFSWDSPRFPLYTEPDDSYHGIRWGKDLGDLQPLAFLLRMRTVPLRNLGACISPDNSWQILQGIETLSLRMGRHSSSALKVARFLEEHAGVAWVRYPGLESHPTHTVAEKYLRNGAGGMVVFGIKGGKEAGGRFTENLELFSHLANVGDAKSLIIHPASTTHSQLSEEQQVEAGLHPDLVRLSIGLEDADDIIEDLQQAFHKL